MSEPVLKVFSYLPNPRVWKALIAADLLNLQIEVAGDKPSNLDKWLWDHQARLLEDHERHSGNPAARESRRGFSQTLFKTDAFMLAHPFGTVPAGFSKDGNVGIFESNSILRAVARLGDQAIGLYGRDVTEASRIDGFLDSILVFSREAQEYLLAMDKMTTYQYERMAEAFEFFSAGIEQTLQHNRFLVGDEMTLADIAFACDFSQFLRERLMQNRLDSVDLHCISHDAQTIYPRTFAHLQNLSTHAVFEKYLGDYNAHIWL